MQTQLRKNHIIISGDTKTEHKTKTFTFLPNPNAPKRKEQQPGHGICQPAGSPSISLAKKANRVTMPRNAGQHKVRR